MSSKILLSTQSKTLLRSNRSVQTALSLANRPSMSTNSEKLKWPSKSKLRTVQNIKFSEKNIETTVYNFLNLIKLKLVVVYWKCFAYWFKYCYNFFVFYKLIYFIDFYLSCQIFFTAQNSKYFLRYKGWKLENSIGS